MKFNYLPLLFIFLLPMGMSAQQHLLIDQIAATVGGKILLASDIEEQYNYMRSQSNRPLPPQARCIIMDQLLTQKLLIHQAELDSIEVSDEEVAAQLDARFEQIMRYMNNDPEMFRQYYGKSMEQMREEQRESLKEQLLAQRMQMQIMADVKITPREVKQFFNNIPKDSLPYFGAEVQVGEIVIYPKPNELAKEAARNKLEEIRRSIIAGEETFAAMAQRHSDDRGSARDGGELGAVKRGVFVPEFEAVAFRLSQGEISQVFESPFGFHIIQLNERRGNVINSRHILIQPEVTAEDKAETYQKLDSIRNLVVSGEMTFERAVLLFSDENEQSRHNAGRVLNQMTGDTYFDLGDIAPDIYFAIDTLKVGEYSKPYTFVNQAGETGMRFVRLISRTEPHVANLQQDYAKIQNAALEEKKTRHMQKWITRRAERTYVHIDPRYLTCDLLNKWLHQPTTSVKP